MYFLEIMTCNASICMMDHPDLTVSNLMGSSIGKKWLLRKVLNRKWVGLSFLVKLKS